jgi:hypothetical protein
MKTHIAGIPSEIGMTTITITTATSTESSSTAKAKSNWKRHGDVDAEYLPEAGRETQDEASAGTKTCPKKGS